MLTAAHCTEDDNGIAILPADMILRVGATYPYLLSLDGKSYFVNEVYGMKVLIIRRLLMI